MVSEDKPLGVSGGGTEAVGDTTPDTDEVAMAAGAERE